MALPNIRFEKWWLENREDLMLPVYVKNEALETWQAAIEDYKASLVPVAYRATIPNKDGTYHWAFGEVKGSGLGVAWYTPLYEIELQKE